MLLEFDNILLVVLYRPPKANVNSFFDCLIDLFNVHLYKFKKIILGGDINTDMNSDSPACLKFKNILSMYDLHIANSDPTYYDTPIPKCIDVVCTNNEHLEVITHFTNISDHLPVLINYPINNKHNFSLPSTSSTSSTCFRSFTEAAEKCFSNKLSRINWDFIYDFNDVDTILKGYW